MRPTSSSTKKPAEQVVKDIRRATRRHFSAEDKIRIVMEGRRGKGCQLPFDAVREAIGNYLEEASYRRAVAQYIGILADQLGVSGIELGGPDQV